MRKKMTAKQFWKVIPPEMVAMYRMKRLDDSSLSIYELGYKNIEITGSVVFDDHGITWTIETTGGIFQFWKEALIIHCIIRRRRVY